MSTPLGIRIKDKNCVDCGGPVTSFLVPDPVWDGLGFEYTDYACLACFGRRLNPKMKRPDDPGEINKEIKKQRTRFQLGTMNLMDGDFCMPFNRSIMIALPPGQVCPSPLYMSVPKESRRSDGSEYSWSWEMTAEELSPGDKGDPDAGRLLRLQPDGSKRVPRGLLTEVLYGKK